MCFQRSEARKRIEKKGVETSALKNVVRILNCGNLDSDIVV